MHRWPPGRKRQGEPLETRELELFGTGPRGLVVRWPTAELFAFDLATGDAPSLPEWTLDEGDRSIFARLIQKVGAA